MKSLFPTLFLLSLAISASADSFRYVGGDISLLPTLEEKNVIYNDHEGNQIPKLLPYLYDQGMNAMRVRLFVDPDNYPGSDKDENACQSLPYVIPLCQEIVANDLDLLLDFHYSDTWADPGKQWIPEAWKNLSEDELVQKVYDYTKETLVTLKGYGVTPRFIQPGNEISYGMLWGPYGQDNPDNHVWFGSSEASWLRFGRFLRSAVKACREECPQAQIIIHTERVAEVDVLTNFYKQMEILDVDYDIIGLSYYPSYHGPLSQLDKALNTVEKEFPLKPIMIVETGYPLFWDLEDSKYPLEYPLDGKTDAAQQQYARDLVSLLLNHDRVNGLFWWALDYNPYGAEIYNWWNAPLFDPFTGRETAALKIIASFGSGHSAVPSLPLGEQEESDQWYDLSGRPIPTPTSPGLYIHNRRKILLP